MVFFTKGSARCLKLDAKKNLSKAKSLGLDVKGLDSYGVADLLKESGEDIFRMKGTAKMLPVAFNVDKTPKKDVIHQAEKPIELFEQLLEYITLPDELVLDQFAGSCNLGKACLNTGRNGLMMEKDHEIYEKAAKALNEHVA